MLSNNNLNKFLISSVLIIFLSQLFLNIIFFQTNIDEIKPENEIVTCYEKIINLKNSDYEKINFINKDIYVIPDFNNFLCLGKVVDLEIEDNNLNIEIANDNSPIQIVISGSKSEISNSKNYFFCPISTSQKCGLDLLGAQSAKKLSQKDHTQKY